MVYRKAGLLKRLEKLREYNADLHALGLTELDVFLSDKTVRYAVERLLFLVAENILDFLDHILSARFETVSESYEEIITNARRQGVLDDALPYSCSAPCKGTVFQWVQFPPGRCRSSR